MTDKEQEFALPMHWLWAEIERRFGAQATAELREGYKEQLRLYGRAQRREDDLRRLPGLKWRLARAQQDGSGTRALEKSIARIEQRLREEGTPIPDAWTDDEEEIANAETETRSV